MTQQAERGLTAHYFLNFSVVADEAFSDKSPPRSFSSTWSKLTHMSQTKHAVLHIDIGNGLITTVEHEKETPVVKIGDVTEVNSLPGQSMHMVLSLRGGQAPRYLFQTNHDAIIFQTTLLQLMHGDHIPQLPHPRQLLKRGPIQKRGRTGVFHDRFAVLVPARLFVMRSREAKYPQHVLSLVSTKVTYSADARLISLPVAGKTYVFRAITDDDASDWVRRLEGSIGLRYNPYKYSRQAVAATDAAQPPEGAQEAEQPQSPLGCREDAATIWHANEAAEFEDSNAEAAAAAHEDLSTTADDMLAGNAMNCIHKLQLVTEEEEPGSLEWQQVANAANWNDAPPGTGVSSDGASTGAGSAGMQHDGSGSPFEGNRDDEALADGRTQGRPAPMWQVPGTAGAQTTMTEPLDGTVDRDILQEAEEVATSARQYQPSAANMQLERQTQATSDEAVLPLQEHIGAVLTRVRSLMSDVSTFKSQQAALAAVDGPSSASHLDEGKLSRNGSLSGKQLIGTSLSDYQDGVAARVLLQQWQARQQDANGTEMSRAFTPTQAARVQELLQQLAALSVDAGQAAGEPDGRLFVGLGDGISLRLLPNMRIVIEMQSTTAPDQASQQQRMTTENTARIAQASIAAARAAEAAVRASQAGAAAS